MPKLVALLYVCLAVIYLVVDAQGGVAWHYLLKIAPLLLLLAFVFIHRLQQGQRWLLLALLFCMLGDVLLAIDGQQLFVFGLGAFLVGHLCYIQQLRPFHRLNKWLLLPYGAFALIMLSIMWPNLGALALPVLVYISVIVSMSLATWHSEQSNGWLIMGGLFFVISDSLIGLSRFWQPIPQAGAWIMLTYYAAQLALLRGFLQPQLAMRQQKACCNP